MIVQRYYRNGCPAHYEYHYRQALADPVLNSPELLFIQEGHEGHDVLVIFMNTAIHLK